MAGFVLTAKSDSLENCTVSYCITPLLDVNLNSVLSVSDISSNTTSSETRATIDLLTRPSGSPSPADGTLLV